MSTLSNGADIHAGRARLGIAAALLAVMLPGASLGLAYSDVTGLESGLLMVGAALLCNVAFFYSVIFSIWGLAPRRVGGALVVALFGFSTLYCFGFVYHYLLYGQLLGDPSIAAALDSNPQEAAEFLRWAGSPRKLVLAGAAALAYGLCLVLVYPRWPTHRSRRGVALGSLALAAALFVGGVYERGLARNNQVYFLTRSVAHAMWNKRAVAEAFRSLGVIEVGTVVGPPEEEVTHVLIIGESTTRRHMSLYGYARPTTPLLDASSSELLVARDACSSRGATAPALIEMLTFATRGDQGPLRTEPGLIPLLKAAGFTTFWLSNHQVYGKFDNWGTLLSAAADVRAFVNKVGWAEGSSLDGQLLEPLDAALGHHAKRKFIVLHLLGAHADYKLRYPPDFRRFTGKEMPPGVRSMSPRQAEMYNEYDNAILYTDHIVAQIMNRLVGRERATVTFLSDHGEALGEDGEFMGHIDGVAPRQVYEIPLVFWLSRQVRERLGARMPEITANLHRPFQSDGMIHTLLDLYGVSHRAFQSDRSLLSDGYRPSARFCDTLQPIRAVSR